MYIDYLKLLAKLSKGDYISMESLQKICKALHCDVGDICVVNDENSEFWAFLFTVPFYDTLSGVKYQSDNE